MIALIRLFLAVATSLIASRARLAAENVRYGSTDRAPAKAAGPRSASEQRPRLLCLAVSLVSVDSQYCCAYPTGNTPQVASSRLSSRLAMEIASPDRASADRRRTPLPNPRDECRQSTMGRSAHSW